MSTILLNSHVQAQVTFSDQPWNKALKQAKKENKLVFVDAYTDWCGWCKVMDKKTFSHPEVGKFMDEMFVSIKVEMEKTEIGKKLSMKYGVNSFPTFLIFNGEGILVGKLTGFSEPEVFLDKLKNILIPENQLKQSGYAKGFKQKYPDFYYDAFAENGKRKFPDSTTFANYFFKQSDFSNEVNWRVVNRFSHLISAGMVHRIGVDKQRIVDNFGIEDYEDFVTNYAFSRLGMVVKNKDAQRLQELINFLNSNLSTPQKTVPFMYLSYYSGTEDWTNMANTIDVLFENNPKLNVDFFNTHAWTLYEKCDDEAVLLRGIGWLKDFMNDSADYAYLDTYAALLYKVGQHDRAMFWCEKAIAAGEKNGEDVTETKALLKKVVEARGEVD